MSIKSAFCLICTICFSVTALSPVTVFAADPPPRPNFLFIMADDFGWADVAFHGGKTPTPRLDGLKKESVELTQHYSYPVCSPTRSALLSGRYATRFGITNPQNPRAYRWNTVTLPVALKSVGYRTALCGKWHLGSNPDWGPQKFGFDHSYGSLAGGVGPWDHRYKKGEFTQTWHRNGKLVEEIGHVTDLITDEAISWMNSNRDEPFLLYVPFTAVHIPIREPEKYTRAVTSKSADRSEREYAACIAHLDDSIGRLLDALYQNGKSENTIVVFTSDNGGISTAKNDDNSYPPDGYAAGMSHGNNLPLRGQKGTVYEGGTRTVTLIRWPARLKSGKFELPVHISDWMPTFCGLAGYQPDHDLKWDGQNIWPALSGREALPERSIYTAGPGFKSVALRHGDWKLIAHDNDPQQPQSRKFELYQIASDPNETKDLAAEMPDKVSELREKLDQAAKSDRDAVANDP